MKQKARTQPAPPLDEFVEKRMPQLGEQIKTHIEIFCEGWSADDREGLYRCIMISVCNWEEDQWQD